MVDRVSNQLMLQGTKSAQRAACKHRAGGTEPKDGARRRECGAAPRRRRLRTCRRAERAATVRRAAAAAGRGRRARSGDVHRSVQRRRSRDGARGEGRGAQLDDGGTGTNGGRGQREAVGGGAEGVRRTWRGRAGCGRHTLRLRVLLPVQTLLRLRQWRLLQQWRHGRAVGARGSARRRSADERIEVWGQLRRVLLVVKRLGREQAGS